MKLADRKTGVGKRAFMFLGIMPALLISGCAMNAMEGVLGSSYTADSGNNKIGLFGGVKSTQIGPYTYQIKAEGNAYTKDSTTYKFAVLRAAQIALENGYTHITVQRSSKTGYRPSRRIAGTSGYTYYGPVGASRSDGSFAQGQYYVPGTAGRTVYGQYKPGYGMVVEMWSPGDIAKQRKKGSKTEFYSAVSTYQKYSSIVRGKPKPLWEVYGVRMENIKSSYAKLENPNISLNQRYFEAAKTAWTVQREELKRFFNQDAPEYRRELNRYAYLVNNQILPSVNKQRTRQGMPALTLKQLIAKKDWTKR